MMNLDLKELLAGNLSRIRNVVRFSNSTRIKDESVAEHSYFTAYYALVLGHVLSNVEGVSVDFGTMLTGALVHDIDEAVSGDFIRHFKYQDPELHRRLDDASSNLMEGAFSSTSDALSGPLYAGWKSAKQDCTVEGDLVAFADFLSVLSYVMNEIDCGNRKLIEQLDDMYVYAKSFYDRMIFRHYGEPKLWLSQVAVLLNTYIGRD